MSSNLQKIQAIPQHIEYLVRISSERQEVVNRLWVVLASIVIITSSNMEASSASVNFFTFIIPKVIFYPIVTIVISFVNIAYAANHLQAYQISKLLRNALELIDPNDDLLLGAGVPFKRSVYLGVKSNYNRIHPIFFPFDKKGASISYRIFKSIVDSVFAITPYVAYAICIPKLECNILSIVSIVVLTISVLSTTILIWSILAWVGFVKFPE